MTGYEGGFLPPRREEKNSESKPCALTKQFNCICPMCNLNDALASNKAWKKANDEREAREAAERNRPRGGMLE